MKSLLIPVALAAGLLFEAAASACPPPPPGYVPPTHEEFLRRSLSDTTDIVYGVVQGPSSGKLSRFKVLHVYRGAAKKGDTIEAPVGWGHPVPVCVGMMGEAPSKPAGAYGVIAFNNSSPELNFIKPEDVQIMIREGWIRSARAR